MFSFYLRAISVDVISIITEALAWGKPSIYIGSIFHSIICTRWLVVFTILLRNDIHLWSMLTVNSRFVRITHIFVDFFVWMALNFGLHTRFYYLSLLILRLHKLNSLFLFYILVYASDNHQNENHNHDGQKYDDYISFLWCFFFSGSGWNALFWILVITYKIICLFLTHNYLCFVATFICRLAFVIISAYLSFREWHYQKIFYYKDNIL